MIYQKYIKRFFDVVFSIIFIICISPVFFITSLLIIIFMGKPIFYTDKRPGLNKKPFTIYKFRTMTNDQFLSDSLRITKLGLFLRKFSIDELPQLINVIKGEMSLIGPRPLLVEYNTYYTQHQNNRFLVKPGISGLAQVSGRNTLTWEEKFNIDVEYVQKISFKIDLVIFYKTIFTVLSSAGFKLSGEANKFSEHE